MIPKGVGIDHTWPGLCETDAWKRLGALVAALAPNNALAIIMASKPNVLTMLPPSRLSQRNCGRPPIRSSWIFVAKNMATIGRNIGLTTESAEANQLSSPAGFFAGKSGGIKITKNSVALPRGLEPLFS